MMSVTAADVYNPLTDWEPHRVCVGIQRRVSEEQCMHGEQFRPSLGPLRSPVLPTAQGMRLYICISHEHNLARGGVVVLLRQPLQVVL